jgi:hypothetical protein
LSLWDRSPFAFVLNSPQMIENTLISFWISQSEVRILPPQLIGPSALVEVAVRGLSNAHLIRVLIG